MFDFEGLRGKRIVLFGAGNEGVCAVDILEKNGIFPACFCDNYKEGTEPKTGLPIIMVNRLLTDYSDTTVLITAITYAPEIIDGLKQMGVSEERIVSEFRVHLFKQPYMSYFEINVVDHCNITCVSCSHFSPIAGKRCWPLEAVQNDLLRISELASQNVDEIHILGGEPLLHPDLLQILIVAREAFPNSVVSLITNGVLLLKQDEKFWDCCKENRITIEVTKYPIKLDYDKITKSVEERNIAFKFHSYTGKAIKTMYKMPLDVEGRQNPEESFADCVLANRWIALMDGKMYTCQIAPNAEHFSKKFGVGMELEVDDYIDIYKVSDIDEILAFLHTPKPFCRYCKPGGIVRGIPWGPSKGEMSEWV